jgi:hypothetical protein
MNKERLPPGKKCVSVFMKIFLAFCTSGHLLGILISAYFFFVVLQLYKQVKLGHKNFVNLKGR